LAKACREVLCMVLGIQACSGLHKLSDRQAADTQAGIQAGIQAVVPPAGIQVDIQVRKFPYNVCLRILSIARLTQIIKATRSIFPVVFSSKTPYVYVLLTF
jgi:hypothetical protein